MERDVDSDPGAQIAGPHAASQHDIVGIDRTVFGIDPGDLFAIVADAGDLAVFDNLCPARARALGQRLGDVDGVGVAIRRDVDSADQIADLKDRGHFLDLLGRDHVHRQIEHLGHRRAALQFLEAFLIGRHRDRAALAITRRLPGFRLKPAVQFAGVLGELGHVDRGAQLPDKAGGMPGGAAGQLLAFAQHDVLPADLGQVIGDRGADHPATDDDHAGTIGKVNSHGVQALILALEGS